MTKRINNLHAQICTVDNIELANDKAKRGKSNNIHVIQHEKNRNKENKELLDALQHLTYKTSEYTTAKIYEPKERIIFKLPFYPDRIVHHAIMNIMEPIWVNIFIANTYACIKGRGIHKLAYDLKKVLRKDPNGTKYCLKIDIKKFYPSINHDILKSIIRRRIKDKKLLSILDEIIDSVDGVPIGNYLSQFFANLYLSYFDHWMKEKVGVKYYFRYADDIVVLSDNKEFLRKVLVLQKLYLRHVLKLEIKPNYQVFPVESRGIDFVGYRFYHTHTCLRKSIKLSIFRLINKYKTKKISKGELIISMSAYFGWLKHCDSKHLLSKIERDTGLHYSNWFGVNSNISSFYDTDIKIIEIAEYSSYFKVHFIYNKVAYTVNSSNKSLYRVLTSHYFPITFKMKQYYNGSK